jgi:DNA polymerase-3 subunit gamma/tau
MGGDAASAVAYLAEDYAAGGDPLTQLQDLLDVIHWVTRLKVAPQAADDPMVAEVDRVQGKAFAAKLSMAELTRAWQMVLKGVREAQSAPAPLQAAEMILIRLAYLTDLPAPADAVKGMAGATPAPRPPTPSGSGPSGGGAPPRASTRAAAPAPTTTQAVARAEPKAQIEESTQPRSLQDIVALCEAHGERALRAELVTSVRPVSFQPGHLQIKVEPGAAKDLPNRLSKFLATATGQRWMITLAETGGAETLGEQRVAAEKARREEIQRSQMMRSILDSFPGAEIEQVRQIGQAALAGVAAASAMMATDGDGDVPPPSGEDDYGDVDPGGDLDL